MHLLFELGARRIPLGLMAAACLVAGPMQSKADCDRDLRCTAIRNFFLRHKSPLAGKAPVFVAVADRHGLDWRLLPGLSMVESSGGKAGTGHNIFGWNSGRASFKSVEGAIEFVGRRLGTSKLYAGTTMDKLRRYNPERTVYPAKVVRFMRQMADEEVD